MEKEEFKLARTRSFIRSCRCSERQALYGWIGEVAANNRTYGGYFG